MGYDIEKWLKDNDKTSVIEKITSNMNFYKLTFWFGVFGLSAALSSIWPIIIFGLFVDVKFESKKLPKSELKKLEYHTKNMENKNKEIDKLIDELHEILEESKKIDNKL